MHHTYVPLRWSAFGSVLLLNLSAWALPQITVQPSPLTNSVSLGAALTNRITATTTNPPLRYQWRRDGADLPDQTNLTIILMNVGTADAGRYTAIATDTIGSVESRPWVVDVDSTFTKLVNDPCVQAPASGGVSWMDVNGDGYLDLFISAGPTGMRSLFTNNQAGGFSRVALGPLPSTSGGGATVWGDFDNDGNLDAFVVGLNANRNFFYQGKGKGVFLPITTNALVQPTGFFTSASCVDYDRDGRLDIFFTDWNGPNRLYHNEGGGVFTRVTNGIVVSDTPRNSHGNSWADYDDDGDLDLMVCNRNGPTYLYRNEGANGFTKVTNVVGALTTGSASVGWADYDNDGRLDFLITGTGNGRRRVLYHNEGGGNFSIQTNAGSLTTDVGEDSSVAWADYDNDGYIDVFIAGGALASPANGHKDFLYRNNGDGTFTRIVTGSLVNDNGEASGAAWGDFDHDGFLDLYVANAQSLTPEKNMLYRNNGNGNAWLALNLEGRASNRSAIGAKVRVQATIGSRTFWQLREISGSLLALSNSSREVLFGLGNATNATAVRIEWPSGIIQELKNVPARQRLNLIEPPLLRPIGFKGRDFTMEIVGGSYQYVLERSTNLIHWIRGHPVGSGVFTLTAPDDGPWPNLFVRLREWVEE